MSSVLTLLNPIINFTPFQVICQQLRFSGRQHAVRRRRPRDDESGRVQLARSTPSIVWQRLTGLAWRKHSSWRHANTASTCRSEGIQWRQPMAHWQSTVLRARPQTENDQRQTGLRLRQSAAADSVNILNRNMCHLVHCVIRARHAKLFASMAWNIHVCFYFNIRGFNLLCSFKTLGFYICAFYAKLLASMAWNIRLFISTVDTLGFYLVCTFNILGFCLHFTLQCFANSLFVLPLVAPAVAFKPHHNCAIH